MYRKLGLLSVPIGVAALIALTLLPGFGVAQQSLIGGTSIRTDRNQYRIGDVISICYSIPPGPTPIMLIDQTPDGRQTVILQGVDDSTGGCFQSTVTPPVGTECLRLLVFTSNFPAPYVAVGQAVPAISTGLIGDATACFRVLEAVGPLPPPSTGVTISTDRRQYVDGDPILVCFNVPVAGAAVVTDILADGRMNTAFANDVNAGTTCLPQGAVRAGPALGNECLRLDAYLSRGASLYGSNQVCFQVTPRVQPQPAPIGPGLRTNKTQYRVGEFVQICYALQGPGQVTLILAGPSGGGGQILNAQDNGTGGCTAIQATLPFGRWCATMTWIGSVDPRGTAPGQLSSLNSQACYQVIGQG